MKPLLKPIIIFICFLSQNAWAEIRMGELPPAVELKEKVGGRLDGSPWDSAELKGKVHILFYVDPDEKDLNNDASEALAKEKFPEEKYQSWAIINLAATWLPNFVISSSLEEKQKQYPRTIYVRDYKKVLVKAWAIADNSSDVLAFDKKGRLIFRKDGKLDSEDIAKMIKAVRDNLEP